MIRFSKIQRFTKFRLLFIIRNVLGQKWYYNRTKLLCFVFDVKKRIIWQGTSFERNTHDFFFFTFFSDRELNSEQTIENNF